MEKSQVRIRRYWWPALVATSLVIVAPPATVIWLENAGYINSALLSVVAGVGGSMAIATLGAAVWMRCADSNDVVFGDLLLWGYFRRLIMEKRIMNSTKLMRETPLNARPGSGDSSQIRTLQKLAEALEAADPYTHGHSRRVARISCMIAKEMGFTKKRIRLLRIAAAVHDVGKLYVPSHIINKPGKLTPEEFEVVKQHCDKGSELVSRTGNRELTAMVRHHHERMDGKGYPDNLAGSTIPLGARIIAVADAFDALTSKRSYRHPAKHKAALNALRQAAGTQLDHDVVQAFLAYYSGRRWLARWALVASAPHRWIGELSGWTQGTAAAGIKGSAAAVGSAALLSGSVLTGTAVAPAVAAHLPKLDRSAGPTQASNAETTGATSSASGLPQGLATRKQLPAGLRNKDKFPGPMKRVTGSKKAHPAGQADKGSGSTKRPSLPDEANKGSRSKNGPSLPDQSNKGDGSAQGHGSQEVPDKSVAEPGKKSLASVAAPRESTAKLATRAKPDKAKPKPKK